MIILLCIRCGEDVTDARSCACDRPTEPRRPLSHIEAVVATAAALGEVTEDTIRTAALALRERAS